ncbi:MAG: hypothetical protein QXT45_05765 [Candidatus Bilamarchaeaceae archaeon]
MGNLIDMVDNWIFELDDHDEWVVVAAYGKLCRVDPTYIEDWRPIEKVSAVVGELARTAIEDMNPDGWIEEAEELAKVCDDGADADEIAHWSESLLVDLDDADLIIWAAEKAGLPEEVWVGAEEKLLKCTRWLFENPDRFFPARDFVMSMHKLFRSDIDDVDTDLASTTVKYLILIDALWEADRILNPPRE